MGKIKQKASKTTAHDIKETNKQHQQFIPGNTVYFFLHVDV